MVFSSFTFLFLFLPAALVGYFLTLSRFRNHFLLAASCIFYGWGAPTVLPFLLISTAVDYLLSSRLAVSEKRRLWLSIGVGYNLAFLGYFKYANFFVEQGNRLAALSGFEPIPWGAVLLPIGVSFFTFQKISFLVDLYRGKAERPERFIDYALFVTLFPQLIAGPIIRFHDIAEQLRGRVHTEERFFSGMLRFSIGLAKKLLIADYLAITADQVFVQAPAAQPTAYLWIGLLAYSFQIYFDFSGYSDMAIGIGKFFGFRFPENFDQPYRSRSFTEFWRRWHMTLSHWMKEYLYIPLGGNRRGAFRTYLNLVIVFLLSGLWHGAAWTFILWGAFHGSFLVLERRFPAVKGSMAAAFLLVTLGWVLFRSPSLQYAGEFYQGLFGLLPLQEGYDAPLLGELLPPRTIAVFIAAALLSFLPLRKIAKWYHSGSESGWAGELFRGASAAALLLLSVCSLAGLGFSPFLYFKF